MAVPWGAIIGGVTSLVKGISGAAKKKSAGGAAAADPRKIAMFNLMQRQRRAAEVGTTAARDQNRRELLNVLRAGYRTGNTRQMSQYMQLRRQLEESLSGRGQLYANLLGQEREELSDIEKRAMDMGEKKEAQAKLEGAALQQGASKALMGGISQLGKGGAIQDAMKSFVGGNKSGGDVVDEVPETGVDESLDG